MVKGKFVYHFADGSKMRDLNGYRTINAAKSWAKSHNLARTTSKGRKVVLVTPVKKRKC